ncbi:C45 family autoproteolytic acyltransferase/hydolase [Paenalkalicoccus suaedae]|nr:C45 family peptidase [Paenalkalicoccus suaedae]
MQIEVIEAKGDAYSFGLLQAQKLKETPLFMKHTNRRKKSIRKYDTDLAESKAWMKELSPVLWEELEGLADGLEWRIQDVIHEYGGYQQNWVKSGCSAIMNNGAYGRNYDYHPKTYDGRFVLWQPSKGFAHVGFAQRIIGRMDGMNEHGLAIGYHFVNRLKPQDGFICCSIARFILDSCKNVKEAVDVLTSLPHRHAFNYSLTDKSGRHAVVEGSGQGAIELKQHDDVCSNHFRLEKKQGENRRILDESKNRLERLKQLRATNPEPLQLLDYLNNTEYGIGKTEYKNWSGTIHSAVYDTKNLTVYAGVGVNGKAIKVPFGDWLKGERYGVRKFRGKLGEILGADHLEERLG